MRATPETHDAGVPPKTSPRCDLLGLRTQAVTPRNAFFPQVYVLSCEACTQRGHLDASLVFFACLPLRSLRLSVNLPLLSTSK